MPNETRTRWRLANSSVKRGGYLVGDVAALRRRDLFPAILGGDDGHLRAGVLADDPVFDDVDRGAAPVLVEDAGFIFFDLVLDDDVEVELLAFAALHLEAVVARDLAFSALLHHGVGLNGDRVLLDATA